jgi:hypothetical protein
MWFDGTEFRSTLSDGSHGGEIPTITVKESPLQVIQRIDDKRTHAFLWIRCGG